MTLNDARANVKIVLLSREEHGCSSELLRHNASIAVIEIKSISASQCNVITQHCVSIILP